MPRKTDSSLVENLCVWEPFLSLDDDQVLSQGISGLIQEEDRRYAEGEKEMRLIEGNSLESPGDRVMRRNLLDGTDGSNCGSLSEHLGDDILHLRHGHSIDLLQQFFFRGIGAR